LDLNGDGFAELAIWRRGFGGIAVLDGEGLAVSDDLSEAVAMYWDVPSTLEFEAVRCVERSTPLTCAAYAVVVDRAAAETGQAQLRCLYRTGS